MQEKTNKTKGIKTFTIRIDQETENKINTIKDIIAEKSLSGTVKKSLSILYEILKYTDKELNTITIDAPSVDEKIRFHLRM